MSIAIEQDKSTAIVEMSQIHEDIEFNCRGKVTPIDVHDLVESIRERGLMQPVLIREYNEECQQATGYKYGLVAGYRRFCAMRCLGKDRIPAKIKFGMSDIEARISNFQENRIRKDLNIVQEAKAVEKLRLCGLSPQDIAKQLHVSAGWVQMRTMVLNFPPDVQEECSKGNIGQQHIKALSTLPKEKLYEEVRRLKNAKLRGEKNFVVKRPISQESKRARTRPEMNFMLDHIYENIGPRDAYLTTRTLAWCVGNISSRDLFEDIKQKMDEKGVFYQIPSEELG